MEIRANRFGEKAVFATKSYKKGEVIHELRGKILKSPTRTSIEIDKDKHVEDRYGRYINHSFEPSASVTGNKLIALRDINEGEEITFDYTVSESNISHPFVDKTTNKLVS